MAKLFRFVQKPLVQRLLLLCLTLLMAWAFLRYWEPPTMTTIALATRVVPSPTYRTTSPRREPEQMQVLLADQRATEEYPPCPITSKRRAISNG
jgi:hypothetical protein